MNCWLGDEKVPLPDLNTQDSRVQDGYSDWIRNLVQEYSIDGLRIDGMYLVFLPTALQSERFFQPQNT